MQVREMKRKAILAIAGLGMLLGASGTSQAADWTVSLDYSGTMIGQLGNTSQSATTLWAFDSRIDGGTNQAIGWGNITQPGESHTAATQGKYILVLRWTPPSSTAVLPSVVRVKVQEQATGSGGYVVPNLHEPGLISTHGTVTLSAEVEAPDGTKDSKPSSSVVQSGTNFNITAQLSFILTVLTNDAQKQTDGSYLLRYPLPSIKSVASMKNGSYTWSDEDGSHSIGDHTNVYTFVDIAPAIDTTHNLYIASNIETSYYKSTVAPTPQPTPPVAAGTPAPTAIPTPTPLPETNPPIWRLPCQRNPDGSMTVESAAVWDAYEGNGRWYGGGQWQPIMTNFSNPTYTWTYSGGFPTANFANKIAAGTQYITTFAGRVGLPAGGYNDYGIELTADPTGSNLASVPSNFGVTVKDASGLIMTNKYTVNWHPPLQMQNTLPTTHHAELTGSPTVEVPRFGEVAVPPVQPTTVSLSTGFEGLGGAIAAFGGPEIAVGYAAIAQGLAGLLDLDVQIGGEPGYNWSNDHDSWTKVIDDPLLHSNVSNQAWLQDTDAGFTHFDVTMKEVRRCDHFRWNCDKYDRNGFVSPNNVVVTETNVAIEYQPFYKLRINEPSGPGPGTGGN